MVHSDETIVKASYGAAVYDSILMVPNQDTLKFITSAGLYRFLPKWISIGTGNVDEEKLEQEVWETVTQSYYTPTQFQKRYAQEPQSSLSSSIRDLNYLLVKEIISLSPEGKVNPLVYKVSTGRVNKQAGIDIIRKIYDQGLETIIDPERRKYYTFVHEQVLQTQQRFIQDLAVVETVLQDEGITRDISDIDVGIFFRVGDDGKPINANPFL